MASDGPLQGSSLEGLAVGVAVALSAIHDAGIVHRDLKPANVLLSGVGARVIDFGIARALDARSGLTKAGQFIGTPAYMAPELLVGRSVTPASDVFSWGCVVAFAGTGQDPFTGNTLPEVLHRVAHEPPWLYGLDPELHDIVAQALSKDPASRPTVATLLEELAGHTGDDPVRIAASNVRPRAEREPSLSTADPPPTSGLAPPRQMPKAPQATRHQPRRDRPDLPRIISLAAVIVGVLLLTGVVAFLLWPDDNGAQQEGTVQPSQSAQSGSAKPQRSSATGQTGLPAVDGGDVDPRFLGRWTGLITHHGAKSSTFSAVITVDGGKLSETVGRSEYASEGCGGYLRLVTASKTRLVVEEHIDQGQGSCRKIVVITLSYQRGGTLGYTYTFTGARGSGILQK